jgi:hypothetical protein
MADEPARRSQWNLATTPAPSVPVQALRALVAHWQAMAALQVGETLPVNIAMDLCAHDLTALCDAAEQEGGHLRPDVD